MGMSPVFSEDPDQERTPIEAFWSEIDAEVPRVVVERDEPIGLDVQPLVTPDVVRLEALSLPELCRELRNRGEYHKAIELEIERFKLRRLGRTIRREFAPPFRTPHRFGGR